MEQCNVKISKRHYYGQRSVPVSRDAAVIPTDRPSYYSKIIGGKHYGAIFNGPTRNTFYINGVETTSFIGEGDGITDYKTFESGCEHTYDFLLLDMGYLNTLGPTARIKGKSGYCVSLGNIPCIVTTEAKITTANTSGPVRYLWDISNGTIESGTGTDTIAFKSADVDTRKILIRCTVIDAYTSTVFEMYIMHKREQLVSKALVPTQVLQPADILKPRGT